MTRARAIIQASNAVLLLIVRLRAAMGPVMGKLSPAARRIAVITIAAMAAAMPQKMPAIAVIALKFAATPTVRGLRSVMAVSLIAEYVRRLRIKVC